MGDLQPIADKDLPDIKVEDIKVDISAVTALKPEELEVVKQSWVCSTRTNEQLVLLLEQCPEKIKRLEDERVRIALVNDENLVTKTKIIDEKISRLKEQYAVCIKEIYIRKPVK